MVIQNKKWSQQSIAASIAETDVVLGLVESVTGKNAQIEIPKLRTRLNTGDQIFDAGVRLSAFGAGLVKTDATGIISVSNAITIDPSAGAGSIAVDANSKTTLKQLTVAALGVTSADGFKLIGADGDNRELTIHIGSDGSAHIGITGSEVINISNLVALNAGSKYGDNDKVRFGNDQDYSQVYSTANDSLQIVDGSTVDTNIRWELLSDGGIKTPSLKSGANQGAAGASAGEQWVDTADQTIKLGV